MPACQHRGGWSGELAFVILRGVSDAQRGHAIHACAVHGECLPTFKCTRRSKRATSEEWTRSDGLDGYALRACQGCEQFSPALPSQPPEQKTKG